MKPLFDLNLIADFIDGQVANQPFIITANQRLANEISAAFESRVGLQDAHCQIKPEILPVEDWITGCWQQLVCQGDQIALSVRPLTANQDLLLWEQIVRNDPDTLLLKPHATARVAQAAQRTLYLWQTPVSGAFSFHPDCARFADWSRQYQQRCTKDGFVSAARLAEIVNEAFRQNKLVRQDAILPIGFQQIPPLYSELFKLGGTKTVEYEKNRCSAKSFRQGFDSTEQEIKAAASWIRAELEENPNQCIALIVPDLKSRRNQIERLFSAEFEPQYQLPDTPRYQCPFNISAGIPLSDTPVIQTALLLLKTLTGELDTLEWLTLLHNPFVFNQTDIRRSLCDAELQIRRTGFAKLTATQLKQILVETEIQQDGALSSWVDALDQLIQERQRLSNHKAPLAYWIERAETLLASFQWPGARSLDSIEYQQVKRWRALLEEFAELSVICGEVSFETMAGMLNRYANGLEFQAESKKSPIQILGMLEGGGLAFDAIWLMGMNDRNWPPSPAPNPFIPIMLQVEQEMPHASAERELGFTKMLFSDYLQGTDKLIASYALWDKDQPLLPSPLLDNTEPFANSSEPGNSYPHPYYNLLLEGIPSSLTRISDANAPPINNSIKPIKGGAQILKDQAACPFKAFATHRLGARALDTPEHLLSASERGVLLHRALELVWKTTHTLQQLKELDIRALNTIINQAATSAVLRLAGKRPDLLGETLVNLEIERLHNLVHTWLKVEMDRQPFEVDATESAARVELSGITLTLRIDRIDRLEDGSLVLIDYKTGECNIRQWQGERPDDPQLPLYSISLAVTNDVCALAFAQVNVDKQRFLGIARQQNVASGITPPEKIKNWEMAREWPDLQVQWRAYLEALMTAFARGEANVDPKNGTTCRYCNLGSLCRVKDARSFSEVSL